MKEKELRPLRYRLYYVNMDNIRELKNFLINKLDNGGSLQDYRIISSFLKGNLRCFILEHIDVKYEKVKDKIIE